MQKILLVVAAALIALSAAAVRADSLLVWHDALNLPVYGTVNADQPAPDRYRRLPDSLIQTIRKPVADLAKNSAGISVRFRSDAATLGARWHSLNKFNMNHMTATGIRGLDLYVLQDDSTWTTVGSARPALHNHNTSTVIISNMEPKMREYMLYLSLYDGVDSLFIGTDSIGTVLPPLVNLPVRRGPIVMYGTSILQGGCANRPGMCHTNILQRKLNREIFNLGFSGNGKYDKEIAQLMSTIDADLYVIDALPNNTPDEIKANFLTFYNTLRANKPTTPIVLVESPIFPLTRFCKEPCETILKKNEILKGFYDELVAAGDNNLFYFEGKDVFGGCQEATVDNYHFTDLGFTIFAEALAPLFAKLIGQ